MRPALAESQKPPRPSVKKKEQSGASQKPVSPKVAPRTGQPKKDSSQRGTAAPTKLPARQSAAEKKRTTSKRVSAQPAHAAKRTERSSASEEKSSRLSHLKRNARKARADKAFDARYAESTRPSSGAETTRAALYKGQMGASHKRSARLQEREKTGSKTKLSVSFFRRDWMQSPKFIGVATVIVCFVISCAFLYPAAKDYYVAIREQAQVQAEYQALEQRNAAIQSEVDKLSTGEGIEDKAREEFGWVKSGDNSVSVYGLEGVDRSSVNANVLEDSIPAPTTWYSPILDALFGVDTSSGSES